MLDVIFIHLSVENVPVQPLGQSQGTTGLPVEVSEPLKDCFIAIALTVRITLQKCYQMFPLPIFLRI